MKIIKKQKAFQGEVQTWSHFSGNTQSEMTFSAFRPEKPSGVLWIWLSGLACDQERFFMKTGALSLKKASDMGWTILCPDTSPRGCVPGDDKDWEIGQAASFYLDATKEPWAKNYKMFSYIHHELRPWALSEWNLDQDKSLISGHSMGGHGALLGALKTDFYRSATAFAPICSPSQGMWGQKAFSTYLEDPAHESANWDAAALMSKDDCGQKTPLLIDQGLADEFYPDQLRPEVLVKAASCVNHPLEYHQREGFDHSYYMIMSFLEDHMNFHSKVLA